MAITVSFHVRMERDRMAALEKRDEIIEALKPLGIRVSLTDDGTEIYLADEGVETLGEHIARRSGEMEAEHGPFLSERENHRLGPVW